MQKGLPIEKDEEKDDFENRVWLIEGRHPEHCTSLLTLRTHVEPQKAQYIKNRAFDDGHYKKMIVEYLRRYGEASRTEIDALLLDKLSDALDTDQKRNKVRNLLQALARKGAIQNAGSRRYPKWGLH